MLIVPLARLLLALIRGPLTVPIALPLTADRLPAVPGRPPIGVDPPLRLIPPGNIVMSPVKVGLKPVILPGTNATRVTP